MHHIVFSPDAFNPDASGSQPAVGHLAALAPFQAAAPAHHVGLGGSLAGHLGLGVLLQAGVQDGIRHLVAQLRRGRREVPEKEGGG